MRALGRGGRAQAGKSVGDSRLGSDAIKEGFEVYPVVELVARTSPVAHEWALQRMLQTGAHPVSWISVMCELQRDWNRSPTVQGMIAIALERSRSFGTELAVKLDRTTVPA